MRVSATTAGQRNLSDAADVREPPAAQPPAFAAVVEQHQQQVAGLCRRLLGWRDDVDDVVQEVFLSALRNLPRFRHQASLGTWLYRITVNQCRRERRKRRLRLRLWPAPAVAAVPPPSETGDRRERSAHVRAAVAALGPRDREVIVLRHLEALPIREIAVILGLRPNTVEVRLNRARQRLKRRLADVVEYGND